MPWPDWKCVLGAIILGCLVAILFDALFGLVTIG
jgi:hypothetical protein